MLNLTHPAAVPPPTLYGGLLYLVNTRAHRAASAALACVTCAWWLTLSAAGLTGTGQSLASPEHALPLAVGSYLFAFVITAGLWVLRTGLRGKSANLWMVAFWVQFIDHLTYAGRAGLLIVDRGLGSLGSLDGSMIQRLAHPLNNPLLHILGATVVFGLMLAALHRHANPSPEEAVSHNCGCAAKSQTVLLES